MCILHVRGQLVEDDGKRFTLKQLRPGFLPRSFKVQHEVLELVLFSELLGDFSPDAMLSVGLTTRERYHPNLAQIADLVEPAHDLLTQVRVLAEETEREEVVRFTAAHALTESENALCAR